MTLPIAKLALRRAAPVLWQRDPRNVSIPLSAALAVCATLLPMPVSFYCHHIRTRGNPFRAERASDRRSIRYDPRCRISTLHSRDRRSISLSGNLALFLPRLSFTSLFFRFDKTGGNRPLLFYLRSNPRLGFFMEIGRFSAS